MRIRLMYASMLALSLTLPLLARAASPASEAKPLSAFDQSMITTEKDLLEALERGDIAYVQNAVADDFVSIGTNGDSGDKGEILGAARHPAPPEHKQSKPILYDFKVVQLNDSAAVVTYNAVLPGSNPRYQHISSTWVKQGDQWKLKFEQTTPNLWSAMDL
jgi:hypothetical protein